MSEQSFTKESLKGQTACEELKGMKQHGLFSIILSRCMCPELRLGVDCSRVRNEAGRDRQKLDHKGSCVHQVSFLFFPILTRGYAYRF